MNLNDNHQNGLFNPFDSLPIMISVFIALMTVLVMYYYPFFG